MMDKSKQKKMVPAIRFSGFTDDWEQRKVSDIFQVTRGHVLSAKAVSPIKTDSNPYPVYSSQTKNNGLMGYYNEYLFNNAITWTTDGANAGTVNYRPGQFYSTNVNGVLLSNDGYVNKAVAESLDKVSYKFVSHVGNPKLMNNVMSEIIINIPSEIAEQARMSELLIDLDHSVTLHQRKLENLEALKKLLLQKMFPKNGQDKPDIRFNGFTDDWEQRKLDEISTRVRGNNGDMTLPTLTISAAMGWLNQKERFSGNIAGAEQENYTLLSKGQLSYNHGNSKLAKYGTVFTLENYQKALVPRVYHSFDVSTAANPKFIEYLFATRKPDRELRKLISSGARMDGLLNINYDAFMSITISVPMKEEQERISRIIDGLNDSITLHQRKLQKLDDVKRSLLQNMFV